MSVGMKVFFSPQNHFQNSHQKQNCTNAMVQQLGQYIVVDV